MSRHGRPSGIHDAPVVWSRETEAFMYRCRDCLTLWPLDREFWTPSETMQRCRACQLTRHARARRALRRRRQLQALLATTPVRCPRRGDYTTATEYAEALRRYNTDWHSRKRARLALADAA